eukprot:3548114-Alexandrium_andersonii.AAC.1
MLKSPACRLALRLRVESRALAAVPQKLPEPCQNAAWFPGGGRGTEMWQSEAASRTRPERESITCFPCLESRALVEFVRGG